jgi:hypothetical protein
MTDDFLFSKKIHVVSTCILYCVLFLLFVQLSRAFVTWVTLADAPSDVPCNPEIIPLLNGEHSDPADLTICGETFKAGELKVNPKLLGILTWKESHCIWRFGRLGEIGYGQIRQEFYDGQFNLFNKRGNILAADEILFNNIKQYGYCGGVRAYNGSGKQAECYAHAILSEYSRKVYGVTSKFNCPVDTEWCTEQDL